MRKYIALGFLLIGLLFLGCTFPSGKTNEENKALEINETNESGERGSDRSESSNESVESNVQNLTGLSYAALIDLGIPIECSYSKTENDMTTNLTIKFKGNKVRGEGTTVKGEVSQAVAFISTEEVMYIKIPSQGAIGPLERCEWLKIANNNIEVNVSTNDGIDLNPMNKFETPEAKFDCKPGVFGDEIFAAPEKSCDISTLVGGLNGTDNVSYQQ